MNPAELYETGEWKGLDLYRCLRCPYSSVGTKGKARIERHVARHARAVAEALGGQPMEATPAEEESEEPADE